MRKTGFGKAAAVFLAVCMLVGMLGLPVTAYAEENTTEFAGGEGTVGNPYKVATAEHLNNVRNYLGAHFEQTAPIDLSGYPNWTSIGSLNNPFAGSYNGNGKTISNLTMHDSTLDHVGLFGLVGGDGALENVKLTNVSITSAAGFHYVGGLAARNEGIITDGSSEGNITIEEYGYAGGLIGFNLGFVSGSHSAGSVTGGAASSVGGLIGASRGSISIRNSYSTSSVTCAENGNAGGLIGGLDLEGSGALSNSYSTGSVNGGSNADAGGLIGSFRSSDNGNISNCYSTGSVSGGSNASVGGLVGLFDNIDYGSIRNSYSTGSVNGGSHAGGLVGDSLSGVVANSYYDTQTSGKSDTGKGTPKTTAEMRRQGTFEGWDFESTWKIGENAACPTLRYQPWTPDERITVDCAALDWDDIDGDNTAPNNITNNLVLPTQGAQGSTIAWSASPTGYINTTTGAVTRPTDADKEVTLTATVSYAGGAAQTKEFGALTVKVLPPSGGGGTPTYRERTLTNSSTGVTVSGDNIHSGAQLTVNTINAQSLPAQMREAIAGGQLIAGYDITLSGGFRGELTLSFPVGAAYNGQIVTILHYVNGRVETYTAVVANGKATVTVSSLSPFAVLSTGVTVPDDVVTDPPKTGDAAMPLGFVMMGLAVLCALCLVMRRKA